MRTTSGQSPRSAMGIARRVYPSDTQPLLQSILAALADLDVVHEARRS